MLLCYLHVALSSLHISLGVYLKIFNMLENACHDLDLLLAANIATSNKTIQLEEFDHYVEVRRKVLELEKAVGHIDDQIVLVNDTLATAVINDPIKEVEIHQAYNPRLGHLEQKRKEKVNI